MFYKILCKFTNYETTSFSGKLALKKRKRAIAALKSPLRMPAWKMSVMFAVAFVVVLHSNSYADNINYVLAARQNDLSKNMNRIADMTANVNTTGFKVERDVFSEFPKRTSANEQLSMTNIATTTRDQSQGVMMTTGRVLDVAISGRGLFMINTPFGQMFTRNGSFMISKDGVLVNQSGYPVAGPSGGQVEFTEKDISISIKEDGIVTAEGEERGQIGVFTFDHYALLERVGAGLFKTNEVPKPAEEYKLAQGMLEGSNVNSVTAMTDLINVSRGVERVIKLASSRNEMQMDMIRKMAQ